MISIIQLYKSLRRDRFFILPVKVCKTARAIKKRSLARKISSYSLLPRQPLIAPSVHPSFGHLIGPISSSPPAWDRIMCAPVRKFRSPAAALLRPIAVVEVFKFKLLSRRHDLTLAFPKLENPFGTPNASRRLELFLPAACLLHTCSPP